MNRAVAAQYTACGCQPANRWAVWFPGHRFAVVMPDEKTARAVADSFNSNRRK